MKNGFRNSDPAFFSSACLLKLVEKVNTCLGQGIFFEKPFRFKLVNACKPCKYTV